MQGPLQDHKFNKLHQGTCRLHIGYLPVSYDESDSPSEESINALITNYTIPSFQLDYATHSHYKANVHIPISEDNSYSGKILALTAICDDRQTNYWSLWRYMETIRSGRTGGYPIKDNTHRIYGKDGHYRNRLTYIPRVEIIMADDSMQRHQKMVFHRCYPLVLSDLSVSFNEPSPITFNISFLFSMQTIERFDPPMEDTKPMSVID